LKILHVIPSLAREHGGPTRALSLMEKELAALGITVDTVTTDDDGPKRRNGKPEGVPLTENGVTRRYFGKRWDFYKFSPALGWWLLRHVRDYDVVHIHALFSFSSIAAAFAARRSGVPYVLRPLGTLARYGVTQRRPKLKRLSLSWLEGPALRRAAAVHFTSDDEMREATQTVGPMNGVVIPLGIESAKMADGSVMRARYPVFGAAPYLLFLSRLDPKKNVEGLLKAFAIVLFERPETRLLIAGDGEPTYVSNLKALAIEVGLGDKVVWAGHIEGDLKASAMAGAEVFVLPSFSENFGIAAAEALMAGLPCVLGQGVAIAQDVVLAGAGVAVAPDPDSIAAGLRDITADPKIRADMSARASALARDKYSVQTMGAMLVQLYSGILK
jgi:glycosyltransferase involved in cell wall biosynthesis